MISKTFIAAIFLSLITGGAGAVYGHPDQTAGEGQVKRPNIVWLISEDNSIHYHRMYDPHGTETPRITALAADGLQFMNAFSNAPVCSVARTTLITGCYAPRIGTQFHRRSISVPMPPIDEAERLQMFPALLRKAGYYTSNKQKKDYNADESSNTWNASSKQASWRDRQPGQPFFHMQSFATTHESSLHFDQEVFENRPTQTDPAKVFVAPYHPDTPLFRYTVAKYHDNIRRVDAEIGNVVDQLAADGLLEDTFIFYFGDHGGVLPRGKGYAYESGLHVPLVVRVPKNWKHLVPWQAGSRVSGFVQFVDFAPTALQLAGVPLPEQFDGSPFLGAGIKAGEVAARDTALGYADRFDEKVDFVRTLRKGKYEYVRSYQPFNFDGLHNNYRYLMLAYQQWRELYQAGELSAVQSQFFRPRAAEMLFDIEKDPHEVHNLANDPAYASVLESLRGELQQRLRAMPDLSFFPESMLAEEALSDPVPFGHSHRQEIAQLMRIADLQLFPFASVEAEIVAAIGDRSAAVRQWALIACSTFGEQAQSLAPLAQRLVEKDQHPLVRTRAAEFLGLIGVSDPRPVIMECLKHTDSPIEANLILNTAVMLQDGLPGWKFSIDAQSMPPQIAKSENVARRLEYFGSTR
ncbi:MAG: sulfatase-like hydrolase/transferase [Pirellulaceae bacterium]